MFPMLGALSMIFSEELQTLKKFKDDIVKFYKFNRQNFVIVNS